MLQILFSIHTIIGLSLIPSAVFAIDGFSRYIRELHLRAYGNASQEPHELSQLLDPYTDDKISWIARYQKDLKNDIPSLIVDLKDLNGYILDFLLRHKKPQQKIYTNPDIISHLQVAPTRNGKLFYEELFPSVTMWGQAYSTLLLGYGQEYDVTVLRERQDLIRFFRDNPQLRTSLQIQLKSIRDQQEIVLDLFDTRSPTYDLISKSVNRMQLPIDLSLSKNNAEFDHGDVIRQPYVLIEEPTDFISSTVKQIASIGIPASLVIGMSLNCLNTLCSALSAWRKANFTWYFGASWKLGMSTSWNLGKIFILNLLALVPAQILYQEHENSKAKHGVIVKKQQHLLKLLNALMVIYQNPDVPKSLRLKLNKEQIMIFKDLIGYLQQLQNPTFSHLYHWQNIISKAAIKEFIKIRNKLLQLLNQVGKIDFYISVSEVMDGLPDKYIFVDFDEQAENPSMSIKKMRPPLLPSNSAIENDFSIGHSQDNNIAILTGANATGKSTFMRSLVTNILLLAQTLGIATAEQMRLAPFKSIHAIMNKNDSTGSVSSFQEEVRRNIDVLQIHESLLEDEKGLFVIDEIFNSTNAEEALEGSKMIIEKFSHIKRSYLLLSSHLQELAIFAEDNENVYSNYHMGIERVDGRLIPKYRIKPGLNRAVNARELFERELFIIEGSER